MNEDPQFWNGLGICFAIGTAASLVNIYRQKEVPTIREALFTSFFSGLSAVGASLCVMEFNQGKANVLQYLLSLAAGLCRVDVLVVIWSKALPAALNYLGQKFMGKPIFDVEEPGKPADKNP